MTDLTTVRAALAAVTAEQVFDAARREMADSFDVPAFEDIVRISHELHLAAIDRLAAAQMFTPCSTAGAS